MLSGRVDLPQVRNLKRNVMIDAPYRYIDIDIDLGAEAEAP